MFFPLKACRDPNVSWSFASTPEFKGQDWKLLSLLTWLAGLLQYKSFLTNKSMLFGVFLMLLLISVVGVNTAVKINYILTKMLIFYQDKLNYSQLYNWTELKFKINLVIVSSSSLVLDRNLSLNFAKGYTCWSIYIMYGNIAFLQKSCIHGMDTFCSIVGIFILCMWSVWILKDYD